MGRNPWQRCAEAADEDREVPDLELLQWEDARELHDLSFVDPERLAVGGTLELLFAHQPCQWQGDELHYRYATGAGCADGYFGPNTLEAVKKFQRAKGLTVDGICGTNTWRKLLNVTSNVLPTLSKNDIYNVTVKAIQGILMGWKYSVGADGADGYYGNNTYNAVRRFQSNNRLGVDGIVGINTWKKLIGVV